MPKKKHKTVSKRVASKVPVVKKVKQGLESLLVDIGGIRVLLPKTSMNEIIKYTRPEPFETAPEWLLGSVDWKNWQVPVLSYSRLSGLGSEQKKAGTHILILKSLADNRQMPYIGMVIYGAPKNLQVEKKTLVEVANAPAALSVFSTVKIGSRESALIPDLDRLNQLVAHAAYGALPITQIQ